ncbi:MULTISPECIES: sigma-54 dependent transcriptional regulator [Clostridium]|uniref:HTH-type transcriptional regulatory protein TyrR n=1 Tax=Clostridium aquiflavi TaxID=3073603 RepID=A0ABU1EDN0_9CLOT|nr:MULTISPECIES: sigma-54 dependent transcriptional regulator [unclassified Clostridium]MDR5586475.1 sigma-54 dependent transcriptional regulator [Clostridium sp. 5N-1]NFG62085.1 sigma-54-dependent Fis family transcriptional regulator [Clostridium botulinum]NFQ10172.1 sigma-54-dependent Fis family transcriptional regulator [Clostridium botulinum]
MRIVRKIKIDNNKKYLDFEVVVFIIKKIFDLEETYNVKIILDIKERGEIPATIILGYILLNISEAKELTLIIDGSNDLELVFKNIEVLLESYINEDNLLEDINIYNTYGLVINNKLNDNEVSISNKPDKAFNKFIGKSNKILDILNLATKSAKSSATVLIRGESGTGKELIAEGIHNASNRKKGPFVRVNCAAIPENLIESELFGHEKGSFTGAIKRKLGKFELANNGTIFLDEIGEMDKNTQAKILRVLQYKEFQRVGGEETIKVDVRVIAATHRNLEEMVKSGEFREDLYYRLNVIPVLIPCLKDRSEDIPMLVNHFINKFQKTGEHKQFSKDVINIFMNYSWNGNVRELENVIERILALNESEIITIKDIPLYINEATQKESKNNIKIFTENDFRGSSKNEILNTIQELDEVLPMKTYEKMIIEKALRKYGSFNAAGKILGLNHKTIAAKAKEFGIEKTVNWRRK